MEESIVMTCGAACLPSSSSCPVTGIQMNVTTPTFQEITLQSEGETGLGKREGYLLIRDSEDLVKLKCHLEDTSPETNFKGENLVSKALSSCPNSHLELLLSQWVRPEFSMSAHAAKSPCTDCTICVCV